MLRAGGRKCRSAPRAFRPSDILKSRKGLTVEVEDTDAEGVWCSAMR